jgi:hypothetical protein
MENNSSKQRRNFPQLTLEAVEISKDKDLTSTGTMTTFIFGRG